MARRKAGKGGRLGDFAEDLGRLLGTTQAKAESWLDQRKDISKRLVGIRDTASQLLADIGIDEARLPVLGRPKKKGVLARIAETARKRRKRRPMSPAAKKALSERMKKYWAERRKQKKG
jgi:hypothetical protein